jgi:hypothetical protein
MGSLKLGAILSQLLTEEDKKALKEAEAKGDDSGCIIA